MVSKYGFFRFPIALEEVYDATLEFWKTNNGKIIEEGNSSEEVIKSLKIQRGISLSSNGEQYLMNFKYNEYEATTYVAIEVSLSLGYGMQWLTPQKFIKQWGRQFDSYSSFKLIRNGDVNKFFDFKKPPVVPATIKITEPEITSKAINQTLIKEEIYSNQPQNLDKDLTILKVPRNNLKFCTNCGTEVSKEHRFCVICGYKLKD
jgi:hypothetical protein